jgi:hypothetical protein
MIEAMASGTIRTGLHSRPSASPEYRPAFDLDKTRVLLIESGLYDIGRALSASVDELLTAMCLAVDRLEQPDADELRACPQCGRLGDWAIIGDAGQPAARFCSKSCGRLFRAEAR